jgi:hypothetical protein
MDKTFTTTKEDAMATKRYADRATNNTVAELLDRTHAVGERGPRTFLARQRLAAALDYGFTPRASDLAWLRRVIREQQPNPKTYAATYKGKPVRVTIPENEEG